MTTDGSGGPEHYRLVMADATGQLLVMNAILDALGPLGITELPVPATPNAYGARFQEHASACTLWPLEFGLTAEERRSIRRHCPLVRQATLLGPVQPYRGRPALTIVL
jgi:hypothetical protein